MMVGIGTFFCAILIVLGSEMFLDKVTSILLSFIFLVIIILIGVIFDIIGVAAAAATEPPLHAKAAKKLPGAKPAVALIRNADRVASFCSDVIGDIAGTVSGAIGAGIIFRLTTLDPTYNPVALGTVMTASVAALTVFGKAVGKTFAINEANSIIFGVGKLINFFELKFGFNMVKSLNHRKQRR